MSPDPPDEEYERQLEREFAAEFPELVRASKTTQPFASVSLGYNEILGEDLTLDEVERLKHSHTIGTTGSGKTNYLTHLIQQDIARGRGILLLDPHGGDPLSPRSSSTLYSNILDYCTRKRLADAGKLHIIDPSHPTHVSCFNPLAPGPGFAPDVIAKTMRECVERVWQQDIHQNPSTARVLLGIFAALSELGLSLNEAAPLLSQEDPSGLRQHAITVVKSRVARETLSDLQALSERRNPAEFDIETKGPRNRINEFTTNDAIRSIIAGTGKPIDLVSIMDQGHVLLVNLQPTSAIAAVDCRLLGTIILRYLFALASRRTNGVPFFVYVDECQDYLTGDVPKLLREVRKHRIGLHLAHQDMQSLADAGDAIKGAVINNTTVKTIFRMTDAVEARDLMDRFTPNIDYEMPVKILIKPTVVDNEIIWLENENTSVNSSETKSSSRTEGVSTGRSVTESSMEAESHSSSDVTSSGTSEGSFEGDADASGYSESFGQSIIPDTGWLAPGFPTQIGTPTVNTLGLTASRTSVSTSGSSRGTTRGKSSATAHAESTSVTYASGYAVSNQEGFSTALSEALASTVGRSSGEGRSQALRPVYKDLPTSVHSRENVLDMIARTIIALPDGEAFVSVPRRAARIKVPFLASRELSRTDRANMIEFAQTHSPFAQETQQAADSSEQRYKAFIEKAAKTRADTPETSDWSDDFAKPERFEGLFATPKPTGPQERPKPGKPHIVVDNDKQDDDPNKPKK